MNSVVLGLYGLFSFIEPLTLAEGTQFLHIAANRTVSPFQDPQLPKPPVSLSQTLTSPNVSFTDSINYICDGLRFGLNPVLSDCESANRYLMPSEEDHTWKPRHVVAGDDSYPLPFRMMGSESVDNIHGFSL